MKYANIRMNIETGDVLLFEGVSLFSRIIKRWTMSRFSHVGLAVWVTVDGAKRLSVIEAHDKQGVRLVPLEKLIAEAAACGERMHWYSVIDSNVSRQYTSNYALSQIGHRYSRWFQFAASFARITRPLWRWLGIGGKDLDKGRWFCSELVAASLFYGGYNPPSGDERNAWLIPPEGVALFTCLRRKGVLE